MLNHAIHLAKQIPRSQRTRVAAVVCNKKGKIISTATNSYTRTHPLMKHFSTLMGLSEFKCFLHAEIAALIKVSTKKPHSIFIARVLCDNSIAIAKPCPACQAAIETYGIKNIQYTKDN